MFLKLKNVSHEIQVQDTFFNILSRFWLLQIWLQSFKKGPYDLKYLSSQNLTLGIKSKSSGFYADFESMRKTRTNSSLKSYWLPVYGTYWSVEKWEFSVTVFVKTQKFLPNDFFGCNIFRFFVTLRMKMRRKRRILLKNFRNKSF